MKIIKEGTQAQIDKVKRFECDKCGCIFEADKTEYESTSQYNETHYHCTCPFCKAIAYKEIPLR